MNEKLLQFKKFIDTHPLSGRHKVKAYCNIFYWQISQLLNPHETVVSFIGNTKLVVKKGLAGATGNIYTGLHEFEDMIFLLHFLRKEDLFFDIGANIGSYTMLASGCNGSKSGSFEPVPLTFEWLKKNIDINNLHNIVHAYNIGVGSEKSILHFTKTFDTVNHIVLNPEENTIKDLIEVKIESIDTIAQTEGIPELVKIDVEGFETEVLKGMTHSLKSTKLKAIIIELNGSGLRYGYDEGLIHENLLNNNFRPYQYFPFERRLALLDNHGSLNTIYIRDIDFVKIRLESAEKVNVFSESF